LEDLGSLGSAYYEGSKSQNDENYKKFLEFFLRFKEEYAHSE
jgi:hypothetical protein